MALFKTVLALLVVLAPLYSHCKPTGGKIIDTLVLDKAAAAEAGLKVNGSCYTLGMYNGATVSIKGRISATRQTGVRVVAKLFKMGCANYLSLEKNNNALKKDEEPCIHRADFENSGFGEYIASAAIEKTVDKSGEEYHFTAGMATYYIDRAPVHTPQAPPTTKPTTPPSTTTTTSTTTTAGVPEVPTSAPKKSDTKTVETDSKRKREAKEDGTKTVQEDNKDEDKSQDSDKKTDEDNKDGDKSQDSDKKTDGNKENKNKEEADNSGGVGKPHQVFTVGKYNTSRAGVYLLQIYLEPLPSSNPSKTSKSPVITASLDVEMRNKYGLLSAIDYPGLVFYGVMTSVYALFGIAWIVMMLCSFNDLVRLQFWVLAVIILGFLEKTFFVAEYSAINLGSDTSGSFMIAEFVSAIKRGLSRMLLIIVAMGFGTVKPRLGDSLFKVVAAGVFYFALALIDGIMRARNDTYHTSDTSSVVTFALLLLLDTFIFYWIFISIVDTRRTLRLRKNYVKLSMYNHFAYTLIFAILATIGFVIWSFVVLEYPSGMCLTDWGEVWLRDCFWHVLFAFILLVVMWIWRPSSNRSRFAYSLVADNDDEEVVFEQGNNKNFDSVKMRMTSKPSTSEPPPVSNQAEDDLRWVEENLPTTAMDKAIPLLVDSDEEVMTTKFEISKMN